MISTRRIMNRMQEMGISLEDMASAMKIPQARMRELLENKEDMVLYQAFCISELLQISNSEIKTYFFCSESTLCTSVNLLEELY